MSALTSTTSSQMLSDKQRLSWLQLMKSENVGPMTFFQLINRFGGAEQALAALPDLSQRGGMRRAIKIYPADKAEQDFARITKLGAQLIAFGESDYPQLLRQIHSAPPLICVRGDLKLLKRPAIAMVGSRNASAIGRRFCRDLAAELSCAGYCVVSGLARGIDTAAHEAAVKQATIAVVAGGIDVFYPPENRELQRRIAKQGVLISEMMPGTQPRAELFPRRNRIISGLSFSVIVVEAALRSGSLITARMALEQNREVFAVPGSPLDDRAAGCNRLINNGAAMVTSVKEVLDNINQLQENRSPQQSTLFEAEAESYDYNEFDDNTAPNATAAIVQLLSTSPVELDDLIRESALEPAQVQSVLMELDLAGRIERHVGQRYSLFAGD